MVKTEFMNLMEQLDKINVSHEKRNHRLLKESVSQEIGKAYDDFKAKTGYDLNELVYGKDGFMNTCYPNDFPDFKGDIIYSEKYWAEFENWLKKEKGIDLAKSEDFKNNTKATQLTEYYWRNDDEIDPERIDSDEAVAAMCERIYEKSGFEDVIDFLQDQGYDIESVKDKNAKGEYVPEDHDDDYIYTDRTGEEYIIEDNDFEGLKETISEIYWQDDYSEVMDYLMGKDYLDESKALKEWGDDDSRFDPDNYYDYDWQERYDYIEDSFIEAIAGSGSSPVFELDSKIDDIPEDIYVAGYDDDDYKLSTNPEDAYYTKIYYIITNAELPQNIISECESINNAESIVTLVTDETERDQYNCKPEELLYKIEATWSIQDLNLSAEEVKDLYADIIAELADEEDEWPEYDPDDYYPN